MCDGGGGGGDPIGLTLGLAPIGPVNLCMQKIKNKKKTLNVRVRPRPSASAEYIKPSYCANMHCPYFWLNKKYKYAIITLYLDY